MEINFNYVHVSASERLEAFTTEKINKLANRYDFIVKADVFFKKENTSEPDTGMIAEIRLSAPGPRLFAESSNSNFEHAVAEVAEQLKTQLEKRKASMKTY
ncbi:MULTISPECIES: ribosome hibernation-promoting factor, HPF/YfiA family [Croceibacter]|jgi:putative sigma-54 modulation protein|uniref:Site-specific recombinase, phage integrase family/ribosomal subunitinterface protein n=1 Tax=Croceibacter atlanticus (strain ATCC BAA-628 / JCM 21780 / CIP 108009 / IAM 15332 / KCTC 12090 / HTCC2559) TaxID=216432 RepID=A3U9H3_CROAH|nr:MULTISPECIES: ribosome-associated translation inhibitor RaiA [Croceibacter]EAP86459.1 site-specific recombinase, phage integrase family/ribosomal subunitinterface protein [Croceibacter atlanticus HTCC2559]MBG26151.1 ribosomal subunit interface protein [Croceibacter sp.]MBW4971064.1 ribosome-associated translation inhibitor RaiA [Croceibacter atlanticus]WSP34136.1 ribosome-associated translation inhibitor RaiA [Croceibacter atlanticus]|tara:strand:- start:1837 stop:2139 length:303 start_codon:yes stop_codon:yes gene_type:complete